ncbi:hypothetical protein PMSD_14720 [Paenibacillus macquariensis subsp. defensor]|nr:hypothetical protein PMSD_14720 [Paenibacillus macquariensis subsp. defensor]
MGKKTILRNTNNLEVEILPSYVTGKGYTYDEVAEILGVQYVSSNNPNGKLIKAIIDFYNIKHKFHHYDSNFLL